MTGTLRGVSNKHCLLSFFFIVSRFCLFCAFTMPRYQVSVYRTIGPLVP